MTHSISGRGLGGGPRLRAECSSAVPMPRREVSYWCAGAHSTVVVFAADAPAPASWECRRCGRPAGTDPTEPPGAVRPQTYKTPMDYVRDRRSDAELDAALTEALAARRRAREVG